MCNCLNLTSAKLVKISPSDPKIRCESLDFKPFVPVWNKPDIHYYLNVQIVTIFILANSLVIGDFAYKPNYRKSESPKLQNIKLNLFQTKYFYNLKCLNWILLWTVVLYSITELEELTLTRTRHLLYLMLTMTHPSPPFLKAHLKSTSLNVPNNSSQTAA